MFSGIIEAKGKARLMSVKAGNHRVRVLKPASWKLAHGDSVAVDGICTTVIASRPSSFDIEFMPETLSKTTAKDMKDGRLVNLERSLRYGARMHGHYVQGHVDAVGKVVSVTKDKKGVHLAVHIPAALRTYVTPRGSIALNGVSLTVARKEKGNAVVALIPYSLRRTTLGQAKAGDRLNIETDLLARYGHGRVPRHAKKQLRKRAVKR